MTPIEAAASAFAAAGLKSEPEGEMLRLISLSDPCTGIELYLLFDDPQCEIDSAREVMKHASLKITGQADDDVKRQVKHRAARLIHDLGLMPEGMTPCESWTAVMLP